MENAIPIETKPRGRPRKAQEISEAISDASPVHTNPCAFVVERHKIKAVSGDSVMEDVTCDEPASVRAFLQFSGARREETFPRSKVYQNHVYKWHMDCGPVCEKHRQKVREDFGTLLTNSRFSAELKSFSDQGFPVPDEKLTRLMWRPVEAPPVVNEYRTQIQEMGEDDAA